MWLQSVRSRFTLAPPELPDNLSRGRIMAQAVSRRPFTGEARVRAMLIHVGFVVDRVALGQVFLRVLRFPWSISFHRRSPKTHIIWGINSVSVSGSSSET
jgi:hypothetical protein